MLTISDVCGRLQLSRSTVLRMLQAGDLAGEKRHACGALCADPTSCRHGTWQVSEASVKAFEEGR
ncbi:helix-turn-helix domain-containing protein [Nonomuraea angiospora]